MASTPEQLAKARAKRKPDELGGRPKGSKNYKTIQKENFRTHLEQMAEEKFAELVDIHLASARYDSSDRKYLIDQLIGKAQERQKLEADIDLDLNLWLKQKELNSAT